MGWRQDKALGCGAGGPTLTPMAVDLASSTEHITSYRIEEGATRVPPCPPSPQTSSCIIRHHRAKCSAYREYRYPLSFAAERVRISLSTYPRWKSMISKQPPRSDRGPSNIFSRQIMPTTESYITISYSITMHRTYAAHPTKPVAAKHLA